ncbi:MAG: Hsp20/alpha crystallin family protein [Verrucomicrobiota bacterium]
MSTELETVTNEAKPAKARNWRRPQYEVSENADAFVVKVHLPGVSKGGVDINLDGESLKIVGSRTASVPEGWRPLHRELAPGDYRLELRLNVQVDEDKIRAEVADGVLNLTLPKSDAVKPRKIKVS